MDKRLLDSVDNFSEFLFVDELDKRLLKLAGKNTVINLGKSAKGHPVLCTRLGSGKKNALIFGFPHPNEPIGSLTCLSLIKLIKKEKSLQKKYTWYIVPCADPDGAKLNEGWFKGKFSVKKYARHFYRSRETLQTDWSFPIKYKDYAFDNPPPNVVALVKLMKAIKPDIVYPIHNDGFGGAYFYISRAMPEKYYDCVINLCNSLSIPLDLGNPNFDEPKFLHLKELKKPVYLNFDFEECYDFYKRLGRDPDKLLEGGTDSIGFAKKLNPRAFGMLGEVPYLYDPHIVNRSPINMTKRDGLLHEVKIESQVVDFVRRAIGYKGIKRDSLLYDLLRATVREEKGDLAADRADLKKSEYKKSETVAEEFSASVLSMFNSALILGELRRLLLECKKTKERDALVRRVEKKIDEFVSYVDRHSDYKTIPIRKLVQLQLGLLLISMDYL
ncbi:Zinc carboxypeptidase [uncultured archaeon]|nr:Zinc carboxypeptidase [uncultured archaeon]